MDKPGPWTQLLMTVITVAGSVVIVWIQLPEQQRQMMILALRSRARRLAARAAQLSGHKAMGRELAGRMAEAEAGYGFTYRLSRARDAL